MLMVVFLCFVLFLLFVITIVIHSIVCMQFLPLITRTCNVSEGIVDLGGPFGLSLFPA